MLVRECKNKSKVVGERRSRSRECRVEQWGKGLCRAVECSHKTKHEVDKKQSCRRNGRVQGGAGFRIGQKHVEVEDNLFRFSDHCYNPLYHCPSFNYHAHSSKTHPPYSAFSTSFPSFSTNACKAL